MRLIYALLAAGTALVNSTAETVLASYELAATHLQRGKVYRLRACVVVDDNNSTDTLTVRVRVGPTTLTGTVCASSGAVDAADADVIVVDLELVVRNVGSASIVTVSGLMTAVGAEGTATARGAFQSLSLDSAVAQKIEVTGAWSVAHADNECHAESFTLTELS